MNIEYYEQQNEKIEKIIDKKRGNAQSFFFWILFILLFFIFQYKSVGTLASIMLGLFLGFLIFGAFGLEASEWFLRLSSDYVKFTKKIEDNKLIIDKLKEEKYKEIERQKTEKNKEGVKKLEKLKRIYAVIYGKRIDDEFSQKYREFFEILQDLSINKYYFDWFGDDWYDLKSLKKYWNSLEKRILKHGIKIKSDNAQRINNQTKISESNSEENGSGVVRDQKIKIIDLEDFQVFDENKKEKDYNKWRLGKRIKIDFLKENQRNIDTGLKGELIVLKLEKDFLAQKGFIDLSEKVKHISQESGDTAGFDILSYDLEGNEKFIEVKTTSKGLEGAFFISSGEREFAEKHINYFIYRLSIEDAGEAKLVIINRDDFLNKFQVVPNQYIVKLKE